MSLVNDSMQSLSTRLTRVQGDVRGDLYGIGQQLIAIQELTGQSQQRLQELRSSLDVWDAGDGLEIARRIKQRFDPAGCFAPGTFAGGI